MNHIVTWRSLTAMADDILAAQTERKEQEEVSEYEKEENEKYGNMMLLGNNIKNVFSTAIGLIAVNDAMSPFKHYNLWQCDTTRRITNEMYLRLRELDGVEILKIVSPYKFIVAPGLAFKFRDVRVRIESLLRDDFVILDSITEHKVNRLKVELAKYAAFSILVLPNGEVDFCYLDVEKSNQEEYDKWLATYNEAIKVSNSLLISGPDKDDQSI